MQNNKARAGYKPVLNYPYAKFYDEISFQMLDDKILIPRVDWSDVKKGNVMETFMWYLFDSTSQDHLLLFTDMMIWSVYLEGGLIQACNNPDLIWKKQGDGYNIHWQWGDKPNEHLLIKPNDLASAEWRLATSEPPPPKPSDHLPSWSL